MNPKSRQLWLNLTTFGWDDRDDESYKHRGGSLSADNLDLIKRALKVSEVEVAAMCVLTEDCYEGKAGTHALVITADPAEPERRKRWYAHVAMANAIKAIVTEITPGRRIDSDSAVTSESAITPPAISIVFGTPKGEPLGDWGFVLDSPAARVLFTPGDI